MSQVAVRERLTPTNQVSEKVHGGQAMANREDARIERSWRSFFVRVRNRSIHLPDGRVDGWICLIVRTSVLLALVYGKGVRAALSWRTDIHQAKWKTRQTDSYLAD